MEKTYLAEKERKIIEEAEKVDDFNIGDFTDNQSIANKLQDAKWKVNQKVLLLEDYYKVWNAVKDIKYSQKEANLTMDKKVYDLIFKTYQEIEKLTNKFNEVKDRFEELAKEKEDEEE